MFSFREHWAHAHDDEQDHFMALAAMYIEADPAYRELGWLREWQAWWLENVGNQGNGASEVGADEFLTDDDRVAQFRQLLESYRSWLLAVEPAIGIALTYPKTEQLVEFTRTIEAVLDGNETHPRVSHDGSS